MALPLSPEENAIFKPPLQVDDVDDDRDDVTTPRKYVPLCDVYSATSPYVGGASGSKKVKAARKITPNLETDDQRKRKLPITQFYTRRCKRKRQEPSFYDSLVSRSEKLGFNDNGEGENEGGEEGVGVRYKEKQKRKVSNSKSFSRSVNVANLSDENRENEGEGNKIVVKSKRKVGNSKLDRDNGIDEGEDEELVIKSKEKPRRKLGLCDGSSGDEGSDEEMALKSKEKLKRKVGKSGNLCDVNREYEGEEGEMVIKSKGKVGNLKLVSHSSKLAIFSNGNSEDESDADEEMVTKNKEKRKRKVANSKLGSHSAKLTNREVGAEDKEMAINSKDKQKRNVGDLKLVSHSGIEGEEEEMVIKNKENLEVVNFCVKSERDDDGEDDGVVVVKHINKKKEKKRRKLVNPELANLGVDANIIGQLNESCSRGTRNSAGKNKVDTNHGGDDCKNSNSTGNIKKRKENCILENHLNNKSSGSRRTKKWVWLSFEGVDPKKFIGLQCKAYWPLDADWYTGRIIGYNSETGRHHVKYVDGDEEHLLLSNERIKFSVSLEEMNRLKLRPSDTSPETDAIDVDEMVVLAASLEDCEALEPGDIIWAKLTGHAMWPAIVLDESLAGGRKGLNKVSGENSVLVQFFGTHDFARVKLKQVISFLRGLLSSFHLKCKKPKFVQGLEEAKMYLSEQKLSKRMLRLQNRINADNNTDSEEDEGSSDSEDEGGLRRKLEDVKNCPFELGDLQVVSLGKIVEDSDLFRDEKFIWPEGYTAVRKFPSVTDPGVRVSYKMEVLRDPDFRTRPLFRVTSDSGEQFKGSTPSACWNKVYKRMRKTQVDNFDESVSGGESERTFGSGSHMFGFSHPEILKLIKELSNSRLLAKSLKLASSKNQGLPAGYRPVRVKWKDLDKCNVCHMDEEYENNLFLQCDKCRMMVHARCYGEREPMDGVLWLCNLCRPGAPVVPPPCCLCPVIGGAMKPTTDGRWAHLACAIWIPETCLSDIKRMEPIDGLRRISKDRWKLLCSICGVPYGACIQCSNHTCRVAYHPLCARAAGFCVELEDEDRLHLIPMDDDEEGQCIRLLSFCRKHRAVSNDRPAVDECVGQKACGYSDYTPPSNPSGCARSEPYNYFGRRGRKEPEVLTAASLKRLYVEDRPYLVGGHSQHDQSSDTLSSSFAGSRYSVDLQKLRCSQLDVSRSILSMVEKYNFMKETFRKRLAFGKSGIHGFGIFTKLPHKAGDMVIEYTGELVRPSIADRREHLIYNSLVGAGTYMFRIDDERVIDATRAGSIAHLINHSCEPNCYSRVINVNSNPHIIIFAKRDIKQWEELTYDYRFFSIDEQLACYCGFPRCRGVVNDTEAEERMAKQYAPRNELIDWGGE
ncbi:histone-lysine N-methyltransferase ATX2-like [Lycium barbarum]|uniref:histone-lysine N-methyltransferase ATX2-like n=1 Tax=Lycium barbarum TaxID=112863 RepID=UPI00293F5E59|nr:histone-lysine N-methyltransferase ATX2-like [Lycium barbarum]XP_060181089.1 histone-lysine N-methyltransferase ATX2-like [Lycium barbarum]XP_060181090.1 histone-lysine N-methyltransferase ATX2-like [Lycium barbarum]XP_060181091.1 histone-lysine N-methyltransferase ATX2-like [Lycium barbarum]XP_060181092.1 histone-lysine N-methyltransferase ATX2-like [Lycium barbarum]XP_060181093.1 histone-lysine N-methyltransferase ATX2-like [Lycium barbarum]XP_060181094.1 histone-lysine N-methyltransfera